MWLRNWQYVVFLIEY